MKKVLFSMGLMATFGTAFSHPGEHGQTPINFVAHLVSEPSHFVYIAVVAVAFVALVFKRKRNAQSSSN